MWKGAQSLLVRDAGARRTGQRDYLNLSEADLPAPPGEVAAGEVESVSELNQHVEGHHQPKGVLAPRVIDEVLDDDERASIGQGLVRRPDQVHLPVQVPVMEDQAHRDDVRPGNGIREEVTRRGRDPIT